jgi:hypothetical protein
VGFKLRNPWGEVQDTDSDYYVRSADGEVVLASTNRQVRDAWGNRVLYIPDYYVRDAYGQIVFSDVQWDRRNAYGEVQAFGIAGTSAPTNDTLPSFDISSSSQVGGELVINPGAWSGVYTTIEIRVQETSDLNNPGTINIDWTSAYSGTATGLDDNDFIYVAARATGPGGTTTVINTTPFGPIEDLASPTLQALTLDDNTHPEDSAATINIGQATTGSTITVQTGSLPTGMTLDSATRTISGTPTTPGTYNFTLRETLTGATNTPNDTALSVVISALAVPTYVGVTAHAAATGAVSVDFTSVAPQSGDLLLILAESANQTGLSLSSPWAEVASSPVGSGTAGAVGSTGLQVWWKISNGTETSVSVGDAGDHTVAVGAVYRGVNTTTPFDVQTNGSLAAADPQTLDSVTTTVANTLIVYCIGNGRDASSSASIAGQTNANLGSLTKRFDQTSTVGAGGGVGIIDGTKATAGATGTTSLNLSGAYELSYIVLALRP